MPDPLELQRRRVPVLSLYAYQEASSSALAILIVLPVDPAQGVADTIVAFSAFTDNSRPGMETVGGSAYPLYRRRVMRRLSDGMTLEWWFANSRMFRFNLASATALNLVVARNSNTSKVTMQRVD